MLFLTRADFDLANTNWWEEEAELVLCDKIGAKVCDALLKYGADANLDVDNLDRLGVFVKDFPAGQGYQGIVFYGQDVLNDGWRLFDYGLTGNF